MTFIAGDDVYDVCTAAIEVSVNWVFILSAGVVEMRSMLNMQATFAFVFKARVYSMDLLLSELM